MFKSQKGFSLVEIILVLVIIAILTGFASYANKGAMTSGNLTRVKADLSTLEIALNNYNNDSTITTKITSENNASDVIQKLVDSKKLTSAPVKTTGCSDFALEAVNGKPHFYTNCSFDGSSKKISIVNKN